MFQSASDRRVEEFRFVVLERRICVETGQFFAVLTEFFRIKTSRVYADSKGAIIVSSDVD